MLFSNHGNIVVIQWLRKILIIGEGGRVNCGMLVVMRGITIQFKIICGWDCPFVSDHCFCASARVFSNNLLHEKHPKKVPRDRATMDNIVQLQDSSTIGSRLSNRDNFAAENYIAIIAPGTRT